MGSLAEQDRWQLMRRVFHEPQALRPGQTNDEVTREAAARFGAIAAGIEARGVAPDVAAHALMQMLFCLFAEDVGILPSGLFTDLLKIGTKRPDAFAQQAACRRDRSLRSSRRGTTPRAWPRGRCRRILPRTAGPGSRGAGKDRVGW